MDGLPKTGQYWGKYDRDKNCWHPLIHHCCDVAVCFQTILQNLPVLRKRIARQGNLDDLSKVQIKRLSALSGPHHFGKCTHRFQTKILASKNNFKNRGHIKEALAAFYNTIIKQRLIKALSLETINEWFESDEIMAQYIMVLLSHHGKPVNPNISIIVKRNWEKIGNIDPIAGIEELMKEIYSWFPEAFNTTDEKEKLPSEPHFQHAFCGLIQLSDWIGSSETFFPFSNNINSDRYSFSREKATEILSKMGIVSSQYAEQIQSEMPSFSKMIGEEDWSPRPLQKKIIEIDNPKEEGSIVCLEAETGSGKTEAAFLHFLKLFKERKIEGMYFALPTRSAATQIYKRIHQMIINSFGENAPPVVQAVPGYIVVDKIQGEQGGTLPRFQVLWNDNENIRYRYRGWAAEHPKRYMAAPIIVGTIDQILLSSLQVSHAHLRSSALLRHLIGVDEIHLSDDYMTVILL
jgi:CRISPR-associated endonuclease/helicase Cas3